jgi:serine/threonine-protein kinase
MKPNPANAQSLVGVLLGGKYRVARVLGRGGMGTVLLARHEVLDQRFAIKLLLGSMTDQPDAIARFMREARAAAKLQSEHVARVTDVGTFEGIGPYMVMEYLSGLDLGQLVEARGPLPISDAVDYVLEALDAVSEAHSIGIIHRDLKPSNLFLAELADGRQLVKVLDFGISKIDPTLDSGPTHHKLTTTHSVLGSPAYIPPEQLKNPSDVDPRADIWSLGVVLYELLTGVLPFQGATAGALFAKIVSEEPTPIDAYRPSVPPDLARVVMQCLRRDANERFDNVLLFADALSKFGSGRARVEIERARARLEEAVPLSQTGMTLRGARDKIAEMPRGGDRTVGDRSAFETLEAPKAVERTHGTWTESHRPPRANARRRAAGLVGVAVFAVVGIGVLGVHNWRHASAPSAATGTDSPTPSAPSNVAPAATNAAPHAVTVAAPASAIPDATSSALATAAPPSTAAPEGSSGVAVGVAAVAVPPPKGAPAPRPQRSPARPPRAANPPPSPAAPGTSAPVRLPSELESQH